MPCVTGQQVYPFLRYNIISGLLVSEFLQVTKITTKLVDSLTRQTHTMGKGLVT